MITNIDYQRQLEAESLQLLQVAGEPEASQLREAQRLANILTGKALTQAKQIFQVESSGNYGIALNSIIMNNLAMTKTSIFASALMSYWALTNHIEHDNAPLLVQNRATLMFSHKGLFADIYKRVISDQYDPNTIDFSVSISTSDNTTVNMFTYDLFTIKDEIPLAGSIYNEFASMHGIKPSNFYPPEFYANHHLLMKQKIQQAFSEA